MANRGYKLQEFVAHGSDVKCLNIGKKSCRVFLTGGDDRKVNLWAFGKPTSLLSLSGHTSPVESVIFDSTEVLVLAGSSNGTIKLWDLEEAKIVRTLSAHRSSCSSVGFHPFGEFFASGSLDTDLKIWDIRKKGCIHTYKGHSRGIRTIKFTPDGRWVVTGGDDNVVKVWDLTAGKLLHDFKFHIGPISCIDFHPQEFLLATGSADRTVKFWDLETFELIGSAGPEATGVCSMIFHRDGRTLFCGLEETLKVLSWEPIRCHDVIDMGWSTLADLSIYEGKLFGCSYHRSCVGVWVSDISLIEPYALGGAPKANDLVDVIYSHEENDFVKLSVSNPISSATLSTGLLDCGDKTKETRKIPCVISNQCSKDVAQENDFIHASNLSSVDSSGFKRNKPAISSRSPPQKIDSRFSSRVSTLNSTRIGKATKNCPNFLNKVDSGFSSRDVSPSSTTSSESRPLTPKDASNRKARTVSKVQATGGSVPVPVIVSRETKELDNSVSCRKETRTGESSFGTVPRKSIHAQEPSFVSGGNESHLTVQSSGSYDDIISSSDGRRPNFVSRVAANGETLAADEKNHNSTRPVAEKNDQVTSLEHTGGSHKKYAESICSSSETSSVKYVRGVAVQLGKTRSLVESWERRERCNSGYTATASSSFDEGVRSDIFPSMPSKLSGCSVEQKGKVQNFDRDYISADVNCIPDALPKNYDLFQKAQVENFDRGSTSEDDNCIPEALLKNHDPFLNAVKSRLTKLQMVRHYWEKNGINGAIGAAAKLPDHSVQVDIVSVLMENVDLFTLDLFLCLLPLLAGLLNSKTERHITIVLEMLVKLLKVFGSVIRSTRSAPSLVGVDLEAERRFDRCNQCFIQLEKIKQILPLLIRRGGLLAKHAQGLNVALLDL